MSSPFRLSAAAVVVALTLAGCGSSSTDDTANASASESVSVPESSASESASGSDTTESVEVQTTESTESTDDSSSGYTVVDDRGVEVTIESTERVIPLDGDVAEIVFALGAGDQVVATDLSATYPPEADALPQIGYQRALSAEPIAAFEPTLLIATDIAGPPEALADLERLGIPLVIVPSEATSTGAAEKIRAVAEALNIPEEGERLATEVQAKIDAAMETAPMADPPPKIAALYLRGAQARLVLGSAYNAHWLIEAAGGVDIADELGVVESAEISDEAMLAAAPDVLLVTISGLESVGGIDGLLEQIPALAQTPAGQNRAVLAYEAQYFLGNGPRTGDALAEIIADLTDLLVS